MFDATYTLAAVDVRYALLIGAVIFAALFALLLMAALVKYGSLWLQAYMSNADVSLLSLIGMSFRQVNPSLIVSAKIMGRQAGLNIDRHHGMSTARLEAHFLAGGDVMNVIRAIVAAHRAGINLDFDRASAVDLAGRDVLDAVRITVFPKVIDCPAPDPGRKTMLSAVAKNGVELRVRARVTVRTNLDQLIGGATEETIIARVGQGIISAIGSAESHMEVMETPDSISKGVLNRGLDANSAFEIVSIDIADIDVGENIGARLQTDQAEADTRMARARAEMRRADAIALQQEMKAKVAENRVLLVLAEAEIPEAMAAAFRAGRLYAKQPLGSPRSHRRDPRPGSSFADRILG
ncbi:MAG TPA: flotillin-like protein FloA [Pirellulaceae bacterium]|nr:flotillin-like protein FloA [Pirellulaceae bacterium]